MPNNDQPIEHYGRMDSQIYIETLNLENTWEADSGDQCLILADVMACFKYCQVIALPYPCPRLAMEIEDTGRTVLHEHLQGADAVYWGTPTVVDNKALFPKSLRAGEIPENWTVEHERLMSKHWTSLAEEYKLKVIVTGLGTGDISALQRLEDMGGGQVVSYKVFGDFSDWVLCRWLKGEPRL